MAVAEPSALVGSIRGSIGGVTFQTQKGRQIVTQRQRPLNKQTAAQLAQRNLAAQRARQWSQLTQAQRDAWAVAAQEIAGDPDTFGVSRTLSPYQFWLWQMMDFDQANFPPEDAATVALKSTTVTEFSISMTAGGPYVVSFESTVGQSSFVGPIYCQRSFMDRQPQRWPNARLVSTGRYIKANSPDIYDDWVAAFGEPISGEWLRFRTHVVKSIGRYKGQDLFYTVQTP